MKHNQKKYCIVAAAVWVLWLAGMGAFGIFVMQPQSRDYTAIHAQFSESNDRVSLARISALEGTRKHQENSLRELTEQIREYLLPDGQRDRMVFEISRIASELKLAEYSGKNRRDVWGQEEKEKISRTWITIQFEAPFRKCAEFVNLLERNTPAVFVESLDIERRHENPGAPRIQMMISFLARPDRNEEKTAAVKNTDNRKQEGSVL